MPGNRRNQPRARDQVEWDACISWRRLLVGVVNAGWSLDELFADFGLVVVTSGAALSEDRALTFQGYMDAAYRNIEVRHPYGSCYYLLEALAVVMETEGPDRLVLPGRELCAAFKRVFDVAPPGFERTGQLTNQPAGEQGRTFPWLLAWRSQASGPISSDPF